MISSFSRQYAFTLIEILVALAIFSLIGLASTGVLTTVIDSDDLSEQRFEQLEQLQRAMLTIERDLLQATPRAARVDWELSKVVISGGDGQFDSDADYLAFVRNGRHNPQLMLPRSTLQPVIYRLQDEQLQRLYSNYVDNPVGFEPKMKVMLDQVSDLQVEFLIPANADREQGWEESYLGEKLPLAIAISIESKTFGKLRREFFLGSLGI